ncbi:MAG TPA: transposase [Kiritimatiellia bacterium]|nr:transposase [Kiritimatiellia bacterium]HMP00489.1 transposase [Kiritimatiellia bacterium]
MPRNARIFQKSICYHLLNRGVNRMDIFTNDLDRQYFLQLISDYKKACDARIYHWVLMGNHYHIIVELAFENLRAFAGGIQQSYAQYHHKRHRTSGVFWQGRFKSKPVEIGSYLVACGRYIERNPVRVGWSELAWNYPWSSAAHYVLNVKDGVTDLNPYLGAFTAQDRVRYGEVLLSGSDEAIIRETVSSRVIGSSRYARTLKTERGRQRLKRGRKA